MIFPHCDSRVLHAPEDNCKYCNANSEWQALRKAWGIAFTGHSDATETVYDLVTNTKSERPLIPCPSERDRPVEVIHKWHGNRPQK